MGENLDEALGEVGRLVESHWGEYVDPNEFMRDTPDFFSSAVLGAYTTILDRSEGRYRPVYQNEVDLRRVRAFAWLVCEHVPMGAAWVNRLVDYTIGTGMDWTVAGDDDKNSPLAKAVKKWLDECLTNSGWSCDLERESFAREVADGEFLAAIERDSGSVRLSVREPDEMTEPLDKRSLEEWLEIDDYVPSWTFGVLTKEGSHDIPKGYHISRNESGTNWEFWEESEFVCWKRNSRRNAKRGFSDFFRPHLYLLRGDRVLTNTAEGAALQAAIAYIVEHAQGATKASVDSIVSQNSITTGRVDPWTGLVERKRRMRPGTRIDVPAGQQYKASLLGSNNSQVYIQVMEACLRLAGTIHAFPEGMLTGTYANNNFASSLVAESPFVQGRLAEQAKRAGQLKTLLTKLVRVGVSLGVFRRFGITSASDAIPVTISVTPAKVFPRDIGALTTALAAQKAQGWVDDKTAITELGRDYDVVMESLKEQKQAGDAAGAPADAAAGAPGVPGASANPGAAGGDAGGAWMGLTRQQWKRNWAAFQDILKGLAARETKPSVARVMLGALGIPAESVDLLLKDASDGKIEIDPPADLLADVGEETNENAGGEPAAGGNVATGKERNPVGKVAGKVAVQEAIVRRRAALLEEFDPSQPRDPKTGQWIDSGVDTSKWKKSDYVANWAATKIKLMEKLAAKGEWDKLDAVYNPKAKNLGKYQKALVQAKANLLALKAKHIETPPKGSVAIPGTAAVAGWKKIGDSLGTEKGGTYLGPDGAKYYVKTPDNVMRAHNEVLASKLYLAAGAGVIEADLIQVDGKVGVATKWADDAAKIPWNDPWSTTLKNKAAEDFAVHAWLANWDAIGAGSENPMDNVKLIGGVPKLVDAGGSLEFKGMGGAGKKPWGPEVSEMVTLKDPAINPSAAAVFGAMTPEQTIASVQKLKAVTDADIDSLVQKYHGGTPAEKATMGSVLKARRDKILEIGETMKKVYSPDAVVPKAEAAKVAATVGPTTLPAKPQIQSKAWAAVQTKIDALHEAALTGDIEKVKAIATNPNANNTYYKKQHAYKEALIAAMSSGAVGEKVQSPAATTLPKYTDVTGKAPEKIPAPPAASAAVDQAFKDKLSNKVSPLIRGVLSEPSELTSDKIDAVFDAVDPNQYDALAAKLKSVNPSMAWKIDTTHAVKTKFANVKMDFTSTATGKPSDALKQMLIDPPNINAAVVRMAFNMTVPDEHESLKNTLQTLKPEMAPAIEKYYNKAKPKPKLPAAMLPVAPTFVSSNKDMVAQNQNDLTTLKNAALNGTWDDVKGTVFKSPKVEAYKKAIDDKFKALSAQASLSDAKSIIGSVKPSKSGLGKVGYWEVKEIKPAVPHVEGNWDPVSSSLQSLGNASFKKVSKEEQKAMVDYTGYKHKPMNKHLRGITTPESNDYAAAAETAASGFKKAAIDLPVNLMLSRKYNVESNDFAVHNFIPGQVIADAAILSTSTDKSIWQGNVHVRMRVAHPGVKGCPADRYSDNSGEREVILLPNQRMVVTKFEPGKPGYGSAYPHVVYVDILPTD